MLRARRRSAALVALAALALAAAVALPADAQRAPAAAAPPAGRCVPGAPTNTCGPGAQCCGNGYCGVPCGDATGECAVCCQLGAYQCVAGQCVAASGLCALPGLGLFACAPGYACASGGRGGGCALSSAAAASAAATASQATGLCPVTGQPPCGGICCASSAACVAQQCVPRTSTIPSPGTPGGTAYCAPGYVAGYTSTGAPSCIFTSYACGAAPGGAPPQCCGSTANLCLNNQAGPCCTPENTCGGVNGRPQFCCPGGCVKSTGECCPTALCNGVCCPGGTACVGGSCCAPGNQCGDTCCPPGVSCVAGVCCQSPNVPCGTSACCSPGSACLQSGTCCQGTPCGSSGCCTAGTQCINGGCQSPAPPPPPPVIYTSGGYNPYYGGAYNPYINSYGGCFPPCSTYGLTCVYGRCVRLGGIGLDG